MKQVFVFTAGNSAARQHLVDSIINPVKEDNWKALVPTEGVEAKPLIYNGLRDSA